MLWIILPAYNEAGNIGLLLGNIASAFPEGDYRVVLVNDGSSDETVAEARGAMGEPPLEVLDRAENRGLAATLAQGLTHAVEAAEDADLLVVMDADNTMNPEQIRDMLAARDAGADVVVASRYAAGAEVVGVPFLRRCLSWLGNTLFGLVLPIRGLRDYTCGYRAFSAGLLRAGLELHGDGFFSESGFSATADVLLKLRPLDPLVAEIPLVLRYDRKATGSKMRILATIGESLQLIFRRRLGRHD